MTQPQSRNNTLPNYTRGEEVFNMTTHIVGGVLGVAALVLCVTLSALRKHPWALGGSIAYGVSMIILYTMSAVYHGLRPCAGKRVLRVLDHCTIYLLIAGTYSPILLTVVREENAPFAFVIFGIEWGVAALAITLTAIDLKKYQVFSMICYLVLGWAVLIAPTLTFRALGGAGFALVLSGGIAYSIGSILYGIGKKRKWIHGIFHLFCLFGSILQFLAIIIYCI